MSAAKANDRKSVLTKAKGKELDGQSQELFKSSPEHNAPNDFGESEEEGWDIMEKHRKIFLQALKTRFDIREPAYQAVRGKKDGDEQNLTHRTVKEFKKKRETAKRRGTSLSQAEVDNILHFVATLVADDPEMLLNKDYRGDIPFLRAADADAPLFFSIINLVVPKSVLEAIRVRCDQSEHRLRLCPLKDVPESRRMRCPKKYGTRRHKDWVPSQRLGNGHVSDTNATPVTPTDENNNEKACLHDEVDVHQIIEQDKKLRKTISAALSATSDRRQQSQQSCFESLLRESNFDTRSQPGNPSVPLQAFESLLQLCPDFIFETAGPSGYTPLQVAVLLYDKEGINYDHLYAIIKALVARRPESIYFEAQYAGGKKSVYRILTETRATKSLADKERRSRVVKLLKEVCIGSHNKSHQEKIDFLYWKPQLEQQICLNLSGETQKLDTEYIRTISSRSGMHYEEVLDFVKLPYWEAGGQNAVETDTSKAQNVKTSEDSLAKTHKTGNPKSAVVSDPYIAIFEWLWSSKVRKIFTVNVEDDGPNPHSNGAIRQSFGFSDDTSHGFEVEIWKWKKFDIDSETIVEAAPTVKQVYLYSSGNTAILRSWACCSGIAKLKNLRQLTIEIWPKNDNDKRDSENYVSELKAKLITQCPHLTNKDEDIVVKYADNGDTSAETQGSQNRGGIKDQEKHEANTAPKFDEWVKKLEPFKEFLSNIPLDDKVVVKVAILDGGVKLTDIDGLRVEESTSWRPDKEAYWAGPSHHGTRMAKCIRQICPMAKFYIARLDDSCLIERQRFTTLSACQALKWALDMDVDIVSMSWSFKRKSEAEDPHQDEFIRLLKSSPKTVLFASLPDLGANSEDIGAYLPVGDGAVIRIGSATIWGEPSKETLYSKPHFVLPGEKIHLPSIKEPVDGSSFATAYAAGVAALFLYCLRAHMKMEDPYVLPDEGIPQDNRAKRLLKAKTPKGMKSIFSVLSRFDNKEGKFVRPYNVFPAEFEDSQDARLTIIRDINSFILPSVDLDKD